MQSPSQIQNRFLHLLHYYFPQPASLLSILDHNDSVIGHLFAIDVIFGLEIHDDLRIYTPRGCQIEFRRLLHNMGYIYEAKADDKVLDESLQSLNVRDIEHWQHTRTGRRVLLLQSHCASSRYPIFSSPCSALMNYLTGHSFVAAYPKSTAIKYMIPNTKAFASPQCPILPIRLQADINDLEHAGFRLRYSSIQWETCRHSCGSTPECPQTLRSEDDHQSQIGNFCSNGTDGYPTSGTVQWCLGGPMCTIEGVVSHAFCEVVYN